MSAETDLSMGDDVSKGVIVRSNISKSLGSVRRWPLGLKVVSVGVGAMAAGGTAFAASNWVVGLDSGSAAEGQAPPSRT